MKKMQLAVALGAMLSISNLSAEILSYNLNVSSNGWENLSPPMPPPFGLTAQPTFTGTFKVDTTLPLSSNIIDFNMVTGSQTWTAASLSSTSSLYGLYPNPNQYQNILLGASSGAAILNIGVAPMANQNYMRLNGIFGETITCQNCVSFSPFSPTTNFNSQIDFLTYFGSQSGFEASITDNAITLTVDIAVVGDVPDPGVLSLWDEGIERVWGNPYDVLYKDTLYTLTIDSRFVTSDPDFTMAAHHCITSKSDCRSDALNWYYGDALYSGYNQEQYEQISMLTAAHEFGHILGVRDEYTDYCISDSCLSITRPQFVLDQSIMGARLTPLTKPRHYDQILSSLGDYFDGSQVLVLNPDYTGLSPLNFEFNLAEFHEHDGTVPEPPIIALLILGFAGLALSRRRKPLVSL